MFIPGFIISLVTFPGVIVHELAHAAFCKITGTKIHKICFFRLGNPAGYVIHDAPTNLWKHILIAVGPFIFNTTIGILLGLIAHSLHLDEHHEEWEAMVVYWLAISIAMHSFPSTGDAKSIWRAIWQKEAPLLPRIVGTPLVFIIFIGAIGSIIWLDAAYGFCIVLALPKALF
jgi:hypothetical protein